LQLEEAAMWPNRRLLDLLGIEIPIIQAPMAGANGSAMAAAVAEVGALGSLPCAMLSADKMAAEVGVFRQRVSAPLNLNFFCHRPAPHDPARENAWRQKLSPYYREMGLDPEATAAAANRTPFDDASCDLVEALRPEVVSFHFGLPEAALLKRVKATGCVILSSATTVAEARWLEDNGCDAIIAQGYEAGGHRGVFLGEDVTTQPGTMALVPQVVDAVEVPVIAAGGIGDGRGIAAAFALGAAGVQIGTAYLFTPEAVISDIHREALARGRDDDTALTNLFSGRPARGLMNRVMRELGPMSDAAPAFPTAGGALAPLKAAAEESGSGDFSSLWSGQGVALGRHADAARLTLDLAAEAGARLAALSSND
jgi:nitronate monooxygenase